MRYVFLFIVLQFQSCIPIKIAPNLTQGKIVNTKKFIKSLGNRYAYIFTDPKEANEFYYYINSKFHIDYDLLEENVPVEIEGIVYYLSFYESSKETQTINLLPILADAALENKGINPMFSDISQSRTGTWYIVLTVNDNDLNDALNPKYPKQKQVEKYLKDLQEEYTTTTNYLEVYLKN